MRLAAYNLAVFEFASRGERARPLGHHPHVRRIGVNQRRFGVRDAADVDVVASAFKHAQRLLLLAIHVTVVFLEGFERDADRLVGGCRLKDHGPAFPSSLASRRLRQYNHGGKQRQSSKYA
jgi:hypothetical protein